MAIFTAISALLGAGGFTGAVTIFGLSPTVSAFILQIGKAIAWSAASAALAPKPSIPRQQVQALLNQAASPRVRIYGEVLVGGVRAFFEAKGGKLYQIIVMAHGQATSVVGYSVNGETVTVNASGVVTGGAPKGYMTLRSRLGGEAGAYTTIRNTFPVIWTDNHRLQGLSTTMAIMDAPPLDELAKVYPRQSQTEIRTILRGAAVLNPATGITAYSDNAGLCIRDYLVHDDGAQIPADRLDGDLFRDFSALCAEAVPLKSGGSEPRYRLSGFYTLEDAPKDVLAQMLATCDGQVYMTAEGQIGILGGAWSEPDVTLTDDDILGLELTSGRDPFTDFNVLKGLYVSRRHKYQEHEAPEWRDEAELLTQPEMVETLEIPMCPSDSQMSRLMKIHRHKARRARVGLLRTNIVGLKARFPKGDGIHTIRVVTSRLGGIDAIFEVTSHAYSVRQRECFIGIAAISNCYTWDPDLEEGVGAPGLDEIGEETEAEPVPAGLALTQVVLTLQDNSSAVKIIGSVDDPGRGGLQLEMEYRKAAAGVWSPMLVGSGDLRGETSVVDDAASYEVRARWRGRETWSGTQSIVTTSNPVAPAAPSGFTATAAAPDVDLAWTNPGANFAKVRVFRGITADFAEAAAIADVSGLPGQPGTYTDTPAAGTWQYWVVALNASNVESPPTGPQTATV